MEQSIKQILDVFSLIAKNANASITIEGGALRCFMKDEPLENHDIDFRLRIREEDVMNFNNSLQLLELSGFLVPNNKEPKRERYFANRYYVGQNKIPVDVIRENTKSDIVANMLRGEVNQGMITKIFCKHHEPFMQAMTDSYQKIIRKNSDLQLQYNSIDMFQFWKRVLKYRIQGWRIADDPKTKEVLPNWLLNKVVLPKDKEEDICPITQCPLIGAKWIAQTNCKHLFDAESFIVSLITRIQDSQEPRCPICRCTQL